MYKSSHTQGNTGSTNADNVNTRNIQTRHQWRAAVTHRSRIANYKGMHGLGQLIVMLFNWSH